MRVAVFVTLRAGKVYTPGGRFWPARLADAKALVATRAVAVLKADRQPALALHAGAVFSDMAPEQTPGGKPVMADPGHTPHSPVILVSPPLVMVVAADTPNAAAAPRVIGAARSTIAG